MEIENTPLQSIEKMGESKEETLKILGRKTTYLCERVVEQSTLV